MAIGNWTGVLGNTDTIIQRHTGLPEMGFPGIIETEIVALSLRSIDPVPIPGAGFFDVFLTINTMGLPELMATPGLPRSMGLMLVDHGMADGGMIIDSFFDVFVLLDIPGLPGSRP